MNVAAYVRVSTEDQDPDLQRRAIQAWAIAHKAPVVSWFEEKISGAAKHRGEFEELRSRLRRGHFDALVVWKYDRLARTTIQLLDVMQECRSRGVHFVSLTEGVDTTTPMGELFFTILAGIAQFERGLTAERIKAGMAAAKARGVHVGRKHRPVPMVTVQKLLAAGQSQGEIAQALHVSRGTLQRSIEAAKVIQKGRRGK